MAKKEGTNVEAVEKSAENKPSFSVVRKFHFSEKPYRLDYEHANYFQSFIFNYYF